MTPKGAWFTILGLLALACAITFFAYTGGRMQVSFTEAEAQERVDAALLKRAEAGKDKHVHVDSATVRFVDGKLHIRAEVSGETKSRKVKATVLSTGVPEYRDGAFYFKPSSFEVKDMKIEKQGGQGFFGKSREKLKQKLEEVAKEKGWDEVIGTFKAEFQEWVAAKAEKAVIAALTSQPVYSFKNDFKGITAKAALEKVEVVGDKLVVTISLVQFGYSVLIAVLIAVAVIVLVGILILNPELLIVGAAIGSIGS